MFFKVKISQDDYISNVLALKKVVRKRMYNTYGLSVLSPDVIWNYLVWPISTTPFRIEETNSIGNKNMTRRPNHKNITLNLQFYPPVLLKRFVMSHKKLKNFPPLVFQLLKKSLISFLPMKRRHFSLRKM